jgi:hypothetical protein
MQTYGKKSSTRPSQTKIGRVETFEEAARRLECDDDPKAFEKVMEKIAKAKPLESGKRHGVAKSR